MTNVLERAALNVARAARGVTAHVNDRDREVARAALEAIDFDVVTRIVAGYDVHEEGVIATPPVVPQDGAARKASALREYVLEGLS